jgi:serine/threonine protein phosphatase PrpC
MNLREKSPETKVGIRGKVGAKLTAISERISAFGNEQRQPQPGEQVNTKGVYPAYDGGAPQNGLPLQSVAPTIEPVRPSPRPRHHPRPMPEYQPETSRNGTPSPQPEDEQHMPRPDPQPEPERKTAPYVYVIGNQTRRVVDRAREEAAKQVSSWYKPGEKPSQQPKETRTRKFVRKHTSEQSRARRISEAVFGQVDTLTAEPPEPRHRKKPQKEPDKRKMQRTRNAASNLYDRAVLHLAEDKYRQQLTQQALEAYSENGNTNTRFETTRVRGKLRVVKADHKQDEHAANQTAKVSQIEQQYRERMDFGGQVLGETIIALDKDRPVYNDLFYVITRSVEDGVTPTVQGVEKAVKEVIKKHEKDPEVAAIFGKDGVGRNYRMLATNLLDMARQQKEAALQNGTDGDLKKDDIDIVFADMQSGARTKLKPRAADRVVDWTQDHAVAVGANPASIGTLAAVTVGLLERAPNSALRALDIVPTSAGAVIPFYLVAGSSVAGTAAYVRHTREQRVDHVLHARQDAEGYQAAADDKIRQEHQRFVHHGDVTAEQLINQRPVDGAFHYDAGISVLREQLQTQPDNPQAHFALINKIGETLARRSLSDRLGVDTIKATEQETLDQGDKRLTDEVISSRQLLQEAAFAVGENAERLNKEITTATDVWETQLKKQINDTDKARKRHARKQSAKVAAIAAGTALVGGELFRGAFLGVQNLIHSGEVAAAAGQVRSIDNQPPPPPRYEQHVVTHTVSPDTWETRTESTNVNTEWVGYRTPRINELGLHNQRVGENAVQWNIDKMPDPHGYGDVQVRNLVDEGKIYYSLWDTNGDPSKTILVKANAPEGGLTLNQDAPSNRMVTVLQNGQPVQISEAELAQYAFDHDLGDFKGNSNLTHKENRFAVNVSVGTINNENGQQVFESLATSRGAGAHEAIITQTTETVEIPPTPAPRPEIVPAADTFTPLDLAPVTPISPRRALESAQEYPERAPVIPLFSPTLLRSAEHDVQPPRAAGSGPAPHTQEQLALDIPDIPVPERGDAKNVLKGLMLTQHMYEDTPNGPVVKAEILESIDTYLNDMAQRGIPQTEAENRFRAVFNYVRLKNANIAVKIKQNSPYQEVVLNEASRENIRNLLYAEPINYKDEVAESFPEYLARFTNEEHVQNQEWGEFIMSFAHAYAAAKDINDTSTRENTHEYNNRTFNNEVVASNVDTILANENREAEPIRSLVSYGSSNRGGRPGPDEDAFFSSGSGFHLAEIGGSESTSPSHEQRIHGLVNALDGLAVQDADGRTIENLSITPEGIMATQKIINGFIERGLLKGIDVVADGAGGHRGGEIASSIATFIFVSEIARSLDNNADITEEQVRNAITFANNTLRSYNSANKSEAITTFVAQVTNKDNETFIASVGDSRVYKQDINGDVVRMTIDHSLGDLIFVENKKTPSKLVTDKALHQPLQLLGELHSNPRILQTKLQPGELLLLVCDGVWGGIKIDDEYTKKVLTQADIDFKKYKDEGNGPLEALNKALGTVFKEVNMRNISGSNPEEMARQLAHPDVGKLSRDNVTAVVVKAAA